MRHGRGHHPMLALQWHGDGGGAEGGSAVARGWGTVQLGAGPHLPAACYGLTLPHVGVSTRSTSWYSLFPEYSTDDTR